MSTIITPILNTLTDFATALPRTPRHVALQPAAELSGALDIGRFLSPAITR